MHSLMKLLCNHLLVFFYLIVITNVVRGKSLQLLTINEDKNTFSLNKEALKDVLSRDEIKDRTVVVVSIAGDFRQGKSFTLNFFLKYLEFTYKMSHKSALSWMGKEDTPLQGFEWKTGQKRVTYGIQIWSEVFCATLPSGEKVAIVLLDTQGLFDHETTSAINSKIFTLSTLISSVQIYNLMQHIPEDKLQLLKFFTDYGSLVAQFQKDTVAKPFQKLLFLVQNWPYPHENPYGNIGGRQLVKRVLETANDQHPELKSVRERIKSYFDDVDGFLMPYPGSKVATSEKFDGRLSDIEEEYKKSLRELVPYLLAPENLTLKRINGQKVKAIDLVSYLDRYVTTLNSDKLPTPKSFMDANAEMSYQKALDAAKNDYTLCMKTVCGNSEQYVQPEVLSRNHARCYENAFAVFESSPKFGDDHIRRSYETLLEEAINQHFRSCRQYNEKKKEIVYLTQKHEEKETKYKKKIRKLQNANDGENFEKVVTAIATGTAAFFAGGPIPAALVGSGYYLLGRPMMEKLGSFFGFNSYEESEDE